MLDAERLRQYLEFYQDLGIKTLYRRPAAAVSAPEITMELPPLAPQGDTLLKIIEEDADMLQKRLDTHSTVAMIWGRNRLWMSGLHADIKADRLQLTSPINGEFSHR